jgi:phosphate transport system permease protein
VTGTVTAAPHPSPPSLALRVPPAEPRIRIRNFDGADVGWLAGSAISAYCLTWLLYERLTPAAGGLGFWVCWYAAFVAIYYLIVRGQRSAVAAKDRVAAVVLTTAGLALVVPLTLIVGYTIYRGWHALRAQFFTETQEFVGPLSPPTEGGGAHAIVGTLEQVGLAVAFSVPLGFLTALFLNEIGGKLARPVRLVVDAMSATPSILAGLFIYAVFILQFGQQQSGLAAALALTVLMLPTVTRTSEVVLRLVPGGLREGALALGGTEARMARLIVLPTARAGLVTAVILGIARAVGETAPLLFTAGGAYRMAWNPIGDRQDSLPLFVYRLIRSPYDAQIDRAWTGAMVLLLIVLVLFVIARLLGGRQTGDDSIWVRRFRRSDTGSAIEEEMSE